MNELIAVFQNVNVHLAFNKNERILCLLETKRKILCLIFYFEGETGKSAHSMKIFFM